MDSSTTATEAVQNSTSPTPPKNPTSTSQTLLYLIGAVVLFIIIIAGIYFTFSYLNKKPQTNPMLLNTPQAKSRLESETANQSGPTTFRSEKYGWSIVYPEKIYLVRTDEKPLSSENNMLESVDFSSRSPENNSAPGDTDLLTFSIQILDNSSGQSLESIANSLSDKEKLKNNLGGFDTTPITVNGSKGLKVTMEGNTEINGWTDLYLPGNSNTNTVRIRYSLDGEGNKNLADQLVSSFKVEEAIN